jgi:hypothetical protein
VGHGCLARFQVAFTVGFHIIFPAFSIGLAAYLMLLEGLWPRTRRHVYMDVYQYWLTNFALREQSISLTGSKTLLSMNQPDGFDCPSWIPRAERRQPSQYRFWPVCPLGG